ncbi:MAG: glutamate 5-kinase [Lentisphaerae bacterium GWF2_45_14]|nr:MAG: glutamate 5-kinase [Lentisphaerae bacterium GWF2_45_14]
MADKNINARKKIIESCGSVIVKVGTRLLTEPALIPLLVSHITKLRARGKKVLLVSSGAVGLGIKTLGLSSRPKKLAAVQGLAAIGQSKLMGRYQEACEAEGFIAAQLLLTMADLRDRKRHLNVLNCINELWARNVLPIVNENDTVSVDELKFGDNDILSGFIATMTKSELTIILTTTDGFHEMKDGEIGPRIPLVEKVTRKLYGYASGTDSSVFSIGGMRSKLKAAEMVTSFGEHLLIADGRDPGIMDKILAGDDVGTLFLPLQEKMQSRKRWIGLFSHPRGKIFIDKGAAEALLKKGSSLLPSGMVGAEGLFRTGDPVEICLEGGELVARGLANFGSADCNRIAGLHSSELEKVLPDAGTVEEVVHRNNLFVYSKNES